MQTARWESLAKTVGPYELRCSLMWRGMPGRESTYVYVQSGSASVSLGMDDQGEQVQHPKWWRITDTLVEEVSLDTVLSDPTAMHMYNGGGSVLHTYMNARKEAQALKQTILPEALQKAVQVDNAAMEASIAEEQAASAPAIAPTELNALASSSEGLSTSDMLDKKDTEIRADASPDASQAAATEASSQEDIQMASESQPLPELTVQESTSPLRLNGGSSADRPRRARRSSITSDTGSVASTSKVKIGDEEDVYDSDEDGEELVELGFAVKPDKKGFKVVKDVGKIGGKPVSSAYQCMSPRIPAHVGSDLAQSSAALEHCTDDMHGLYKPNGVRDADQCTA